MVELRAELGFALEAFEFAVFCVSSAADLMTRFVQLSVESLINRSCPPSRSFPEFYIGQFANHHTFWIWNWIWIAIFANPVLKAPVHLMAAIQIQSQSK